MLIILALTSSFLVYKRYLQESKYVSDLIFKEVESIVLENENLLQYLSSTLKRNGSFKDPYILNIIKDTHQLSYKSLASSYISWADKDGIIKVSGKGGVLENGTLKIDHRSYFNSALEDPERLKISPVERSIFSNKLVIPTVLGVEDQGTVKGFLVLGLAYNELLTFIKKAIRNESFEFIISIDNQLFVKSNDQQEEGHLNNFFRKKFIKDNQRQMEVTLSLKPKELLWWIIAENTIFLPLYLFLFLLGIQVSTYRTLVLDVKRALNGWSFQKEKEASSIISLDSLKADILAFEKEKREESKRLDMLSSSIKYALISVEEKEKYYHNYQFNISSNLKLIADKLSNLQSDENKEGKITDSLIQDIERIMNNDWLQEKEFPLNIGYLIEECLTFHLKSIRELGVIVRKNIKIKELFFTGKYDVIKGILLSVLGYAASRMRSNGEIHIFSETIRIEDTKHIKLIIRHTRAIKPDNLFKSHNESLPDLIERAKKVKNLKFTYEYKEELHGTFTFIFIEPVVKNGFFDVNNPRYRTGMR